MKKKTFVIALCLALVVAFAAGGAIAWLTDTTDSVTNTFTVGNVKLDLYEHDAATNEPLKCRRAARSAMCSCGLPRRIMTCRTTAASS